MTNRGKRKAYLFFSPILIFLLHIPFVFASTKLRAIYMGPTKGLIQSEIKDSFNIANLAPVQQTKAGIYDSLDLAGHGLTKQVFDYAMTGYDCLTEAGKIKTEGIISIADFSKSSGKKRLFVIDLNNYKLLFNTYVAHGMNSGQEYARQFSNTPESNKSSLGFYRTAATYAGKHGYSLHLEGLEKGINDNAFKRDIVLHGADYVSESTIHALGYIGRSQGCPAVPLRFYKPIIDKIKNGTCLFIYGDDKNYLRRSAIVNNTGALLVAR